MPRKADPVSWFSHGNRSHVPHASFLPRIHPAAGRQDLLLVSDVAAVWTRNLITHHGLLDVMSQYKALTLVNSKSWSNSLSWNFSHNSEHSFCQINGTLLANRSRDSLFIGETGRQTRGSLTVWEQGGNVKCFQNSSLLLALEFPDFVF